MQDICTFYEKALNKSRFDKSRLDIYELEGVDDNKFFVEKTYKNDEQVYEYVNLKMMILKYLYFNEKIKNIKNLSSLRLLDISDNSFIDNITKLLYLVNLELFFIKNTSGKFLDLQKLKHLKYLQIGSCKTINIVDIASCEKLSSLGISQTRVENLSLLGKRNILELSIEDCENIDFKDICNLKSIEKLHIISCQIENLDGIEKLINLKCLNLSNNKIKSLPKQISTLRKLKILKLQNNALETLPVDIDKLPLKRLELKNNPFETLPSSLNNIPEEMIDLEFKNIALYDKKAKRKLDNLQKGDCMFENDINLKLMIIQKLMYEDEILLPKFDIYDFVEENNLDLEKIGYEIVPQALQYFKNLPICFCSWR